jgi:hypothetical protein
VKGLSKTALYRDQSQKYEDFLLRMSAVTGVGEGKKPVKILYEVNEIYEPLSANVQHNLALPEGITAEDMDLMRQLADWNYHYQFIGKQVGRITGGPFVGEVAGLFDRFVETGGGAPKLSIYSGHQRTILGLEAALGIETERTDGIADGEYAVRLTFTSSEGSRPITIPGCDGEMCSLDSFMAVAREVVPRDWRQACTM